jgi:hypothetical protein
MDQSRRPDWYSWTLILRFLFWGKWRCLLVSWVPTFQKDLLLLCTTLYSVTSQWTVKFIFTDSFFRSDWNQLLKISSIFGAEIFISALLKKSIIAFYFKQSEYRPDPSAYLLYESQQQTTSINWSTEWSVPLKFSANNTAVICILSHTCCISSYGLMVDIMSETARRTEQNVFRYNRTIIREKIKNSVLYL